MSFKSLLVLFEFFYSFWIHILIQWASKLIYVEKKILATQNFEMWEVFQFKLKMGYVW